MISLPRTLDALRQCGISHLVGLPDNDTAALFDQAAAATQPPRLVRVTREGEAFAIAAGLWVGGARPLVVIQNTGLLEAGDALRGTCLRMGVPLLCLIGYRGYRRTFEEVAQHHRRPPGTLKNLRSTRYDSAALLTEPTLRAWKMPYRLLSGDPLDAIRRGLQQAEQGSRPVALLLTQPLGVAAC